MIILGKSAFKQSPTKGPDEIFKGLISGYMAGKQLSMEEKQLQASIAAQEARTQALQNAQAMEQERMGWERGDRAANLAAGEALGRIGTGGSRARAAEAKVQGAIDSSLGVVSKAMGIPLPTMMAPPGAVAGVLRKEHQDTLDWAAKVARGMPMDKAAQFMDMVGQKLSEDEIHLLRGETKQQIIDAFQRGLLDDIEMSGKPIRSEQTAGQVQQWLRLLDNPTSNPEAILAEFNALKAQKAQAAAREATVTSALETDAKINQGLSSMGQEVPWAEVQAWRNKLRYGEIELPMFQEGAARLRKGLVPIFDPVEGKDRWVEKKDAKEMEALLGARAKELANPSKAEAAAREQEGLIRGQIEVIRGEYDLMKLEGKGSPEIDQALEGAEKFVWDQAKDNPMADPNELWATAYRLAEGRAGVRLPRATVTEEEYMQVLAQKSAEFFAGGMNREEAKAAAVAYGKMWMSTRQFPIGTPEEQAKSEATVVREAMKPPTDDQVLLESGVELIPGELAAAKARAAEKAGLDGASVKLMQDTADSLIKANYDGPPPTSRATWAKALFWARANSKQTFVSDRSPLKSNEASSAATLLQQIGRKKGWTLPSTDEEKRKLREELIQELSVGPRNP